MSSPLAAALSDVRWQPCFRVVPSRLPTVQHFERIAAPEDWDALYWLESLTGSERLPLEDRVHGPGSPVMAPFTLLAPAGTRFADSTFGVFYAAAELDTAIAESRYHREKFLRSTRQTPIELDMRTYVADVSAKLHDIRGQRLRMPQIYDPDSYVSSQMFGRALNLGGADGVVYDSVRDAAGECLAVFKPRLIQNLRQGLHLRYVWNGASIDRVYELRPLERTLS